MSTRAGPPRRPTRSCRCWRSMSRSTSSCRVGHRLAPPAIRRVGRRLLAARMRARALAEPAADRGRCRATCVELTRLFGLGDDRHLTPLQPDDGPDAAADRPAGRSTLSGAPRATRRAARTGTTTAAPTTTTTSGPTTAASTTAGVRRAQAADDAGEFIDAVKARVARRRPLRLCARHRAARPLVVRRPAVAGGGARPGRAAGSTLTTLDEATLERHPPAPVDSASSHRHQLGSRRRPTHLERPVRGRPRLAGP